MRIFLRPITENDTNNIVKWRNSDKVRSHCMTKTPITAESHQKFYKEYVLTGKYKQFIVERVEEVTGLASYPIATVYLKDFDYENKRCELCIFTSNDVEWNSEGQKIAIQLLLKKAFVDYGMHKVYSYVINKFSEDIDLLKDAGFSIETTLKEEYLGEDGIFEDVIRFCIFSNDIH